MVSPFEIEPMSKEHQTVLIVEDNPALAESMSFALSTFGWKVAGPVNSVDEALAAVRDVIFDVAVLDVDLGRETSMPVADALRDARIPFVFLTGYEDDAGIPPEFKDATCFTKPMVPEALVETLKKLVEKSLSDH